MSNPIENIRPSRPIPAGEQNEEQPQDEEDQMDGEGDEREEGEGTERNDIESVRRSVQKEEGIGNNIDIVIDEGGQNSES